MPPVEQDSDVVCQPGIGWMELNDILKQKGRFDSKVSWKILLTHADAGIPLFFPVRCNNHKDRLALT